MAEVGTLPFVVWATSYVEFQAGDRIFIPCKVILYLTHSFSVPHSMRPITSAPPMLIICTLAQKTDVKSLKNYKELFVT